MYESGPSAEMAAESNSQVQVGRARRLLQEQLLFLFPPSEEGSGQNIKGRKRQKAQKSHSTQPVTSGHRLDNLPHAPWDTLLLVLRLCTVAGRPLSASPWRTLPRSRRLEQHPHHTLPTWLHHIFPRDAHPYHCTAHFTVCLHYLKVSFMKAETSVCFAYPLFPALKQCLA